MKIPIIIIIGIILVIFIITGIIMACITMAYKKSYAGNFEQMASDKGQIKYLKEYSQKHPEITAEQPKISFMPQSSDNTQQTS